MVRILLKNGSPYRLAHLVSPLPLPSCTIAAAVEPRREIKLALLDGNRVFCYFYKEMLEIVTYDNDVLHKQTSLIPEIDRSIQELAQAMIETMHEGDGIGLAGPQVGELKRIFVIHVADDVPRVFINPQIIETSISTSAYEEGCLSIPGVYADVVRPDSVKVQAWNERGRPFTLEAGGMLARVIQHENDHLNGVLFIDRINSKKRDRLISTYFKKQKALVSGSSC